MRAFLAIEIEDRIKDTICGVIERLSAAGTGVSWVGRGQIHLTLWFFEDLEDSHVPNLAASIRESVFSISPFGLEVLGTGVFGSREKPRVFWCGLEGETGKLKVLHMEIEKGLNAMGYKADKPFNPHLTLGRNKSGGRQDKAVSILHGLKYFSAGKFTVTHLTLFRSDLLPGGAVHTPLIRFTLGEKP